MKTFISRIVLCGASAILVLGCEPGRVTVGDGTVTAASVPTPDPQKTVLINDLTVVEDPTRTLDPCAPASDPAAGTRPWSFGELMRQIAASRHIADPSTMTYNLFKTWETDQTVATASGPRTVAARPLIDRYLLTPWVARSAGRGQGVVDLNLAPFRLLAIVNRTDLQDLSAASPMAGQGRFVFGAVYTDGTICRKLPFTLILEYTQLGVTAANVRSWGLGWYGQNAKTFGVDFSPSLQVLTDAFSKNANGIQPLTLSALRTDEVALAPVTGSWEMRELHIGPSGFVLSPTTNSADSSFNGSAAALNAFHCVTSPDLPSSYWGGNSPNLPTQWSADGGVPAAQRHSFALNATCSGCHYMETGTFGFQHVMPRESGSVAPLSPFLTGCATDGGVPQIATAYCSGSTEHVVDPVNQTVAYDFNELSRRAQLLAQIVTGTIPSGSACLR